MRHSIRAGSLFLCSIAIVIGMLLNNNTYWDIVDVSVILLCATNGVLILKNKPVGGSSA